MVIFEYTLGILCEMQYDEKCDKTSLQEKINEDAFTRAGAPDTNLSQTDMSKRAATPALLQSYKTIPNSRLYCS